jgi:hypothetical protein
MRAKMLKFSEFMFTNLIVVCFAKRLVASSILLIFFSLEFVNGQHPDVDKANGLCSRSFTGTFRLWYGNDLYVDQSYHLSGKPAPGKPDVVTWQATYGKYNDLKGYWITFINDKECWQAVKTCGPLDFWNKDHKATGSPEDWELFVFVRAGDGKVKIQNIYGCFVRYNYSIFVCDTKDENTASVFVVE